MDDEHDGPDLREVSGDEASGRWEYRVHAAGVWRVSVQRETRTFPHGERQVYAWWVSPADGPHFRPAEPRLRPRLDLAIDTAVEHILTLERATERLL